jgi:hypothetical protein
MVATATAAAINAAGRPDPCLNLFILHPPKDFEKKSKHGERPDESENDGLKRRVMLAGLHL